jgi:hypothetical protein
MAWWWHCLLIMKSKISVMTTTLALLVALTAASPSAKAHGMGLPEMGLIDGLYQGLPECVPYDLPEKLNALPLPEVNLKNPGMIPPITDDTDERWLINGKAMGPMTFQQESILYYNVFPNQEYVYLPPKTQILRAGEKESPFQWAFPEGMTFFHRIEVQKYNGAPPLFFEMRMIKRLGQRWAFGVYQRTISNRCPGQLELRKEPLKAMLDIKVIRGLKKIEYRARPLDPRACVQCHGMGMGEGDGVTSTQIGPCNYRFVETLQKGIDHPLFGPKN